MLKGKALNSTMSSFVWMNGRNAPMSAGKSDRSILAKDGDNGTGNSTKARTYAIAESSAVMVMVRILRAVALFGCCMVKVRFIMLLS